MNEGEDKKGKLGFTFFESYHKTAKRLREDASRLAFYDALCEFWFEDKEPDFSQLPEDKAETVRAFWDLIRPVLASDKRKKQASAKGGRNSKNVSRNVGNKHASKNYKINSESIVNQYQVEGEGEGEGEGEVEGEVEDEVRVEGGGESVESYSHAHATPHVAKNDSSKKHKQAREFWNEILAVYPSHRRHLPSEDALRFIEENCLWERTEEIKASVQQYIVEDSNWRLQKYVPKMERFIVEGLWLAAPTPEGGEEVKQVRIVKNTHPPETKVDLSDGIDVPEFKESEEERRAREFWEEIRKVYPPEGKDDRAASIEILQFIEKEKLWEQVDAVRASVLRNRAENRLWKDGRVPSMEKFIKRELWKK